MGGLSRKAFLINKSLKKEPQALVIDGGALFFPHPYLSTGQQEAARRTAEGIGQAMAEMRTKAIGISPFDLAAGPDFLVRLGRKNNLLLLSANIYANNAQDPLFKPYLLTKADNITIGIIGLTGDMPNNRHQKQFRVLPWQSTLPVILKKIENKADLIILLSSASRRSNEKIAQKFRKIHLIIESGQGNGNQAPININNTLLCQAASRGKSVGILNIDWNNSKTWGDDIPGQLKNTQNRLDRIRWQIGRMQKRHQPKELQKNPQFQRLTRNKKELEQKIRTLMNQKNDAENSPCQYRNTFIAMETSLPEDKTAKDIVARTRRDVNKMNRKRQIKQRQRREKQRQTGSNQKTSGPLDNMAGWQACKKCHPTQVAFYLQTDHAQAWQTLVKRDQQYNTDCIGCHVTLPSYDQKLTSQEALLFNIPAKLHGVGCETCHGPALRHTLDPENIVPKKPREVTCRQCHTQKRDKSFNFTEKMNKTRCPAG